MIVSAEVIIWDEAGENTMTFRLQGHDVDTVTQDAAKLAKAALKAAKEAS